MRRFADSAIAVAAACAVSSCASTGRLDNSFAADPISEAGLLPGFLETSEGAQVFSLCERSVDAQECGENGVGLGAVGLGGIFVPLRLRLTEMTLAPEDDNVKANFKSVINAIPVNCARANLNLNESKSRLTFGAFYCNWLGVGNVLTRLTLDIDYLSDENGTFGGRYALNFNGTGNGGGQGYFHAIPSSGSGGDSVGEPSESAAS